MTTINHLLTIRRDGILEIAARHGITSVRVFGSMARGEETPESDVDFLIEMEPKRSLFDLARFLVEVEDLLGRSVDAVEPSGLHHTIRENVLREAVPL